jgi:trans-aconitate 2-methyltransferase
VDDHDALLAHLSALLAPGGQLAFQVPAHHDHDSHVVAGEVAQEEPFASALHGARRHTPVLPPERYARRLHELGFAEQLVTLRVYAHVLASTADVVEWTKGTLLTYYGQRLPVELYADFVDRYRERLLVRMGDRRPCFYPFKRILAWGRR